MAQGDVRTAINIEKKPKLENKSTEPNQSSDLNPMQSIADFKPIKKLALPIEQTTFEKDWHTIKEPGETKGVFITRWVEIEGCKPTKMPKPKVNAVKQDIRMPLMMERILFNMEMNQKQNST